MKLTLSQQELEAAVRRYVEGLINLQPGTKVDIEFTAGRGEKGITAEIDINYLSMDRLPIATGPSPAEAAQDAASAPDKGTPAVTAADPQVKAPVTQDAVKPASTRKTTGKSVFGGGTEPADKGAAKEPEKLTDAPDTRPLDEQIATYDDAEQAEAAQAIGAAGDAAPAPTGGERKSLFAN